MWLLRNGVCSFSLHLPGDMPRAAPLLAPHTMPSCPQVWNVIVWANGDSSSPSPHLIMPRKYLFLLEDLLSALQKSSQTSLLSERGHIIWKREAEIKQDEITTCCSHTVGSFAVHTARFVPRQNFWSSVQLHYSFCTFKYIHWSVNLCILG